MMKGHVWELMSIVEFGIDDAILMKGGMKLLALPQDCELMLVNDIKQIVENEDLANSIDVAIRWLKQKGLTSHKEIDYVLKLVFFELLEKNKNTKNKPKDLTDAWLGDQKSKLQTKYAALNREMDPRSRKFFECFNSGVEATYVHIDNPINRGKIYAVLFAIALAAIALKKTKASSKDSESKEATEFFKTYGNLLLMIPYLVLGGMTVAMLLGVVNRRGFFQQAHDVALRRNYVQEPQGRPQEHAIETTDDDAIIEENNLDTSQAPQ